jgi:hypothetical protein
MYDRYAGRVSVAWMLGIRAGSAPMIVQRCSDGPGTMLVRQTSALAVSLGWPLWQVSSPRNSKSQSRLRRDHRSVQSPSYQWQERPPCWDLHHGLSSLRLAASAEPNSHRPLEEILSTAVGHQETAHDCPVSRHLDGLSYRNSPAHELGISNNEDGACRIALSSLHIDGRRVFVERCFRFASGSSSHVALALMLRHEALAR